MRNQCKVARIGCAGLCMIVIVGTAPAASQDPQPGQRQGGKVEIKIELGTPFYMDGMEVVLRGTLKNETESSIKMVPAEKCYSNGAWQILLNVPMTPPPELLGPKASDYTVEVPAGRVHTFALGLKRHGARGKEVLRAMVTLDYMQNDKVGSVSAECEFRVTRRADLEVLKSKDRIVRTGKDHPWMPNKAYRVRVQKARYQGTVYLVSFAFAGPDEGREPDSANVIDEVEADAGFVLGSLPGEEIAALLAYEKGDEVKIMRLSAHSGGPLAEQAAQKGPSK